MNNVHCTNRWQSISKVPGVLDFSASNLSCHEGGLFGLCFIELLFLYVMPLNRNCIIKIQCASQIVFKNFFLEVFTTKNR